MSPVNWHLENSQPKFTKTKSKYRKCAITTDRTTTHILLHYWPNDLNSLGFVFSISENGYELQNIFKWSKQTVVVLFISSRRTICVKCVIVFNASFVRSYMVKGFGAAVAVVFVAFFSFLVNSVRFQSVNMQPQWDPLKKNTFQSHKYVVKKLLDRK